jgi:hypothetical protein
VLSAQGSLRARCYVGALGPPIVADPTAVGLTQHKHNLSNSLTVTMHATKHIR